MTIDAKGLREKAVALYREPVGAYLERWTLVQKPGVDPHLALPADLAKAVLACVEAAVAWSKATPGEDFNQNFALCQAVEAVISRLDAAGGRG